LLVPPKQAEVDDFAASAAPLKELARRHDLLVSGGWGVGADLIGWIYGLENMVFAGYDNPRFLEELLDIIAVWNRARMEVVLEAEIDLFIKRAWYENCHFWTPEAYRKFLYPIVRDDAKLAHEKNAKFGYIITSSCMPLLDVFAKAGIDVIIGVDPAQWDMNEARKRLAGKVALWGGVNGHLTVESGSSDDVRREVREAMKIMSPGSGFILSPVDNVRENTDRAVENTRVLIDEWSRLTGQ
jgi:uroporphyrinogen-III decarboxylase